MDEVLGLREQESESQTFFNRWRGFVKELESGYDWCLAEYENDVDSRVLLDGLLGYLSVYQLQELQKIDERFRQITRETDRPFGRPLEARERPWHTRLPLNPIGELRQDLESLGFL